MPWVLVASASPSPRGSWAPRLGNPLLGPFLGALALGLAANLYARCATRPADPPGARPGPARPRLVRPAEPGRLLLSGQSVTGLDQGFQMFMMTMALVAGLLFSNALIANETEA